MKSGSAYRTCSKSSSILPAANFRPIGLPQERSLNSSTKPLKSSLVSIPGIVAGEWMFSPKGFPLISAISEVTFSAWSWPPRPGFVAWPILISIASAFFKLSSVTEYWFGTYSKMYLYAFFISSGRIPPSPLHWAVFTAALPLANAILVSLERAPKDMWVM